MLSSSHAIVHGISSLPMDPATYIVLAEIQDQIQTLKNPLNSKIVLTSLESIKNYIDTTLCCLTFSYSTSDHN